MKPRGKLSRKKPGTLDHCNDYPLGYHMRENESYFDKLLRCQSLSLTLPVLS